MVSREHKRAALHEKLQLLRSITNSHAVIPCIISWGFCFHWLSYSYIFSWIRSFYIRMFDYGKWTLSLLFHLFHFFLPFVIRILGFWLWSSSMSSLNSYTHAPWFPIFYECLVIFSLPLSNFSFSLITQFRII